MIASSAITADTIVHAADCHGAASRPPNMVPVDSTAAPIRPVSATTRNTRTLRSGENPRMASNGMATASTSAMAPGITPVIGASAGANRSSSVCGGRGMSGDVSQCPTRLVTSGNPPSAIATVVSSVQRPSFEPPTSGIPALLRRPFSRNQKAARKKTASSDMSCVAQTLVMNVRHGVAVSYRVSSASRPSSDPATDDTATTLSAMTMARRLRSSVATTGRRLARMTAQMRRVSTEIPTTATTTSSDCSSPRVSRTNASDSSTPRRTASTSSPATDTQTRAVAAAGSATVVSTYVTIASRRAGFRASSYFTSLNAVGGKPAALKATAARLLTESRSRDGPEAASGRMWRVSSGRPSG